MRDGINTPIVAAWGVIAAVALFGFIVGIQALYLGYAQADQQQKTDEGAFGTNLLVEQEAQLQQQGWIDRLEGVLAIPIEDAMRITVEEMQQKESAQDNPDRTDTQT